MPSYIALLRKDPDSDYGVEFPDFPGCVTAGKDLEEARGLAEEVLVFHLEGMLEDGTPLPEPSGFEHVMADPANRQAIALLVEIPEKQAAATVHVDIALPESTLREIDTKAQSRGISRSAFLVEAALDALRKSA
jgi:predicted RNase H-like HicB family nuclease